MSVSALGSSVTTIATDGFAMAGDGQAEAMDTIIAFNRAKIRRLPDGSLFGMAGRSADSETLSRWLIEGGKKPKLGSLSALRLYPDGRLEWISELCDPIQIDAPCAVGSGMDYALGAMDAGASPERAVRIAARRDPGTGGAITVLHIADGQ
jgi:ATP-dependent protease HslVU (ClpYQ) peptidase subunit